MATLEERTPFEPPTLEETGGQAISSINNGAVSLRYRSYTPNSTVAETPAAGQRIVFLVQSSDYEQLLANKCYLRLPLKMAYDLNGRVASLAPLALMASAQLRINGQVVQSVDNVYETAVFNLRSKANYKDMCSSMGGWYYPSRQGMPYELVSEGADSNDGKASGAAPALAAVGVGDETAIRDNCVLPALKQIKIEQDRFMHSDRQNALKCRQMVEGTDFVVPLGLIFGMCSEAQDFAIPKSEIEFSFVIHSDFSKRINAGINLAQNSDVFDVETAVTITTGNVSLFAAMSIPLDFKGSAGQSFLFECPHWTVDTFVPTSSDHTAQISVAPSTYKAMVAVQQKDVNTRTALALNDWRAGYEGLNVTTGGLVTFTGGAVGTSLFLNRNRANSKQRHLQEVECRLGSARAPDRPYDLFWADDGLQKSDVYRAYLDHVAATHGVLVGEGIETFEDWLDYGAITSFPLIRPHDERSSMMTVRTKFAGEGVTAESEFVNRRVLVYTCSRRNVVLDYSSSENASVQVDDTV